MIFQLLHRRHRLICNAQEERLVAVLTVSAGSINGVSLSINDASLNCVVLCYPDAGSFSSMGAPND
jgi:hypothetical protein